MAVVDDRVDAIVHHDNDACNLHGHCSVLATVVTYVSIDARLPAGLGLG